MENLKKLQGITLSEAKDERELRHEAELSRIYQSVCDFISAKINELIAAINFGTNDIDRTAEQLANLKRLSQCFEGFLDKFDHYEKMKKSFGETLRNRLSECKKLLKKEDVQESDLAKIVDCDSYLHRATQNYSLHEHVAASDVESVYTDFQKMISNFFQTTIASLTDSLSLGNFNLNRVRAEFESVQVCFYRMRKLRESENIERSTSDAYAEALKLLAGLVQATKKEIDANLDAIIVQNKEANKETWVIVKYNSNCNHNYHYNSNLNLIFICKTIYQNKT